MAQRVIRQLVDDLDGSVIAHGTGERLRFALRGREYWLDLSDANVKRLDEALQPFIDAAVAVTKDRRHNRGASVQQPPGLGKRAALIRAWAREHGYDVPIRGRISGEIVTAFEAAQPDEATAAWVAHDVGHHVGRNGGHPGASELRSRSHVADSA